MTSEGDDGSPVMRHGACVGVESLPDRSQRRFDSSESTVDQHAARSLSSSREDAHWKRAMRPRIGQAETVEKENDGGCRRIKRRSKQMRRAVALALALQVHRTFSVEIAICGSFSFRKSYVRRIVPATLLTDEIAESRRSNSIVIQNVHRVLSHCTARSGGARHNIIRAQHEEDEQKPNRTTVDPNDCVSR